MPKKKHSEGGEIDMTPMIDVVFQLIIFFIVTIQMEKNYKEEIELPDSVNGPLIKKQPPQTMIVEVDKRGDISLHGIPLSKGQFHSLMIQRYKNYGAFPVLIRGDKLARHRDIRKVMDVCSGAGIWKIHFVAINEHKAKD